MNGTIFDKALKMAEGGHLDKWPEIAEAIKCAVYFDFPARAHEVLDREYDEAQMELVESFFLPFPIVAVEDTASCVILIDLHDNQKGLDTNRGFITMAHSAIGKEEFNMEATEQINKAGTGGKTAHRQDTLATLGSDVLQIASGIFRLSECNPISHVTEGHLNDIIVCEMKKGIVEGLKADSLDKPDWKQYTDHLINDATVTCEILMYFNKPKNWIIERSPIKRKKLGKGRLPRVHQRPVYIMCTQDELYSNLGLKGKGTGKASHARRRHFRTLKHEKYGENQGKRILIPATWIGPSEIEHGKRKYRVMLDL